MYHSQHKAEDLWSSTHFWSNKRRFKSTGKQIKDRQDLTEAWKWWYVFSVTSLAVYVMWQVSTAHSVKWVDACSCISCTMYVWFQEEVKAVGSALSVHGHNVKVTEVVKDGDVLTFLIVSEKVRKQLSATSSRSYVRVTRQPRCRVWCVCSWLVRGSTTFTGPTLTLNGCSSICSRRKSPAFRES